MTDTEAAKIAKGLTEAQRRMMLKVRDWPSDDHMVTTLAALNRHTFRALFRRRLLSSFRAQMIDCALFTPLGQRVRAYLTGASDNA